MGHMIDWQRCGYFSINAGPSGCREFNIDYQAISKVGVGMLSGFAGDMEAALVIAPVLRAIARNSEIHRPIRFPDHIPVCSPPADGVCSRGCDGYGHPVEGMRRQVEDMYRWVMDMRRQVEDMYRWAMDMRRQAGDMCQWLTGTPRRGGDIRLRCGPGSILRFPGDRSDDPLPIPVFLLPSSSFS